MMSVLRVTDRFIWSVQDFLGSGVTGSVFKCREKKKGKPFAAKVLNRNSEMRPYEIRMRETEVLRKLSHPNIVQLYAMEKEHGTNSVVIIMELCEISLCEVLEQPENFNGLNDRDFLEVIQDVSSGMEYLRANKVVHRDVKPGNILRSQRNNGRHTYKISDFGTARELEKNDQFTSYLYGTEEYLHPDLYECAVMNMYKSKVFNSTVDLWSLGVTFYHLASGQLPFLPQGGRQNKDTMFQMITTKKPGAISCHQDANTGKLVYCDKLPSDTQITAGLKRLITPVLAGLLETDPQHMIVHDLCFKNLYNIVDRKAIDVFFTRTSMIYRLYMQKEDNFIHLQNAIGLEIGVDMKEYQIFHNFQEFNPDPTIGILHYPDISPDNPLILDTKQYVPSIDIHTKKIPDVKVTPRGTSEEDAKLAKLYSNLTFSLKQDTDNLQLILKAISKAHDIMEYYAKTWFKDEQAYCNNIRQKISSKWNQILHNQEHLERIKEARNIYDDQVIPDDYKVIYDRVINVLTKLESEFSDILDKKVLMEEWFASGDYLKTLPWDDIINDDVKNIKKVFQQFVEDRKHPMNNLIDLTHRYEKELLSTNYCRLKEQHASLIEHRNKLHDQFVKWLISLNHHKETTTSLKEQLLLEIKEFDEYYLGNIRQYETGIDRMLSQCTHDFTKLEEELMALDCMTDIHSLVLDQGDKLRMLQEMDESENISQTESI